MYILVTNNSLGNFYGTESWTFAMTEELKRQGHDVTALTNWVGDTADRMNCKITTRYDHRHYDLAIVNHSTCWDKLPDSLNKIFTSHSKFVSIEQPPEGARWVGVNEYINPDSVIRNGIDCDRFKPTSVNKELKTILYLSNPDYANGRKVVEEACKGYKVIYIEKQIFDIEVLINQADLVISMARGALEAMACGKNVIYGDWRAEWCKSFQGGGMITKDNFNKFKKGDYSDKPIKFTAQTLRDEIEKYDYRTGEYLREQVLEHYNIEKTCKKYLTYIKKDI